MRYEYDFALAGSTGQIGQVLDRELSDRGTVHRIQRGDDLTQAPTAKHVINAAGYTKFDDHIERYWQDNIRFAVQLASWAENHESFFHQLSSEAVAEYRDDVLTEGLFSDPRAHPRMIDYALSKVLMEQAVVSVGGKFSIYRCSDFVPTPGRFAQEWRRNHWLTILFRAGKDGFAPGDDFPVWIASVGDIARALALFITDENHRSIYHLLGHVYYWSDFQAAAQSGMSAGLMHQKLVDIVTPVIRIDPPLALCIDQKHTEKELNRLDFHWEYLGFDYWKLYGEEAWAWT